MSRYIISLYRKYFDIEYQKLKPEIWEPTPGTVRKYPLLPQAPWPVQPEQESLACSGSDSWATFSSL